LSWPVPRKPSFDVLVLGGGAAGCALAGRLSENSDRSVCLVEAGPDYGHYDVDPPRGRPNLTMLADTLVDRVLSEDGRAAGAAAAASRDSRISTWRTPRRSPRSRARIRT
jgi:2-polyprenyl-6-methoxyphenol hydroxylase-like FAD-dependent oxidoreductase